MKLFKLRGRSRRQGRVSRGESLEESKDVGAPAVRNRATHAHSGDHVNDIEGSGQAEGGTVIDLAAGNYGTGSSAGEGWVPAPHHLRMLAWAIDSAILAVALTPAVLFWRADVELGLLLLLIIAVFVAYHTGFIWLTQQTIGKALFNLQVHRTNGQTTLPWALGRAGIGYIGVDFFMMGCLLAIFDERHRSFHDRIFRSEVIYESNEPLRLYIVLERIKNFADRLNAFIGQRARTAKRFKALWRLVAWLTRSTNSAVLRVITRTRLLQETVGGSDAVNRAASGPSKWLIRSATATTTSAVAMTTVVIVGLSPSPVDACGLVTSGVAELAAAHAAAPLPPNRRLAALNLTQGVWDAAPDGCTYESNNVDVNLAVIRDATDRGKRLVSYAEYQQQGGMWVEVPGSEYDLSWHDARREGVPVHGVGDEAYFTAPFDEMLAIATLFVRTGQTVVIAEIGFDPLNETAEQLHEASRYSGAATKRLAQLVIARL